MSYPCYPVVILEIRLLSLSGCHTLVIRLLSLLSCCPVYRNSARYYPLNFFKEPSSIWCPQPKISLPQLKKKRSSVNWPNILLLQPSSSRWANFVRLFFQWRHKSQEEIQWTAPLNWTIVHGNLPLQPMPAAPMPAEPMTHGKGWQLRLSQRACGDNPMGQRFETVRCTISPRGIVLFWSRWKAPPYGKNTFHRLVARPELDCTFWIDSTASANNQNT